MRRAVLALAVAVLVSGVGCAAKRVYLNRDVGKVLVLIPFDMETQGEGNGVKAWKHIEAEVAARGYALVPRETVENWYVSKKFIGAPEQVQSYTTQELCKEFGVEAVMWSNLPKWGKVTLGIYNEIKVEVHAELHDKDGVKVWEGTGGWGDSQANAGRGRGSLLGALIDTAVKIATDPEIYADEAARECFRSFPWAGWDPEAKAAQGDLSGAPAPAPEPAK